jgi:hypothetical protein
MTTIHVSRLLAALASAALSLPAQQLADGWQSDVTALPAGAGNVLRVGDDRVWFTGTDLVLTQANATRSLLHFSTAVFGSFTIQANASALLFGENSTGDVWLVPLQGPLAPHVLANLPFNYDAVLWGPGRALVSAKLSGFGTPDNDVVALDLVTGAVTPLLRVPGASGPLALDPAGNLCYATATLTFPAPPASVQLLRWSASQLQAAFGSSVLGLQEASVLYAGLDAASDLVCDSDGDLYFTDWWNAQVGVLENAGGPRPHRSVLFEYGSAAWSAVNLQFLGQPAGPGQAWFEPFQPDGGGALLVHETDFLPQGTNQVRTIRALRPAAGHTGGDPIPSGNFELRATSAPRGGLALFVLAPAAAPGETSLWFSGFEQPLFWNLGMFAAASTWLVPVDGTGRAHVSLSNPGFAGGLQAAVQVAFLAPNGVIGSTAVHDLRLGR